MKDKYQEFEEQGFVKGVKILYDNKTEEILDYIYFDNRINEWSACTKEGTHIGMDLVTLIKG